MKHSRKVLWLVAAVMAVATVLFVGLDPAGRAHGRNSYLSDFKAQYQATVGTRLDNCGTCHLDFGGGGPLNAYGDALLASDFDFAGIESADSDLDGASNVAEINALFMPGLSCTTYTQASAAPAGLANYVELDQPGCGPATPTPSPTPAPTPTPTPAPTPTPTPTTAPTPSPTPAPTPGPGDTDLDGYLDALEAACGSNFLVAASVPERIDGAFAGVDDDGDTQVDESLPPGAATYDCDEDGFIGTTESVVYASSPHDQHPCRYGGWPADLWDQAPLSENKITVQDLTAFIAPVRRLGTSPGNLDFSPRWDLVPGNGIFSATINVQDMTALVSLTPPMLNGVRALNGPACPYP